MSLEQFFVRVDYISPNKDVLKKWTFNGYEWNVENGWSVPMPINDARECEKHKGAFKVNWPKETNTDLADRLNALERRVNALEGTPEHAETTRRGRPPKEKSD